jgi:hypothetical protein
MILGSNKVFGLTPHGFTVAGYEHLLDIIWIRILQAILERLVSKKQDTIDIYGLTASVCACHYNEIGQFNCTGKYEFRQYSC